MANLPQSPALSKISEIPRRVGNPLTNARHERLAQLIAEGCFTQHRAYAEVYKRELSPEERDKWAKIRPTGSHRTVSRVCNLPAVKDRVAEILQIKHEMLLHESMEGYVHTREMVIKGLIDLYEKAMAVVPVTDRNGNRIGVYKADFRGAVKALELLGLEKGMFERTHKHIHKASPLNGTRSQIIGRLGELLRNLSDADLADIGLQRLGTVEVRAERDAGVGEESIQALSAVSKAG